MGNFEEMSRQLRYTFASLESAQGKAKRRLLRKAHLLLLLADEMIADAEADRPISDAVSVAGRQLSDDSLNALTLLRAFAGSAERGACRGLQTVLVIRQH